MKAEPKKQEQQKSAQPVIPDATQAAADDGFVSASTDTGDRIARWLTKADWVKRDKDDVFERGYVWQGRIVDAFLVQGEKGQNAAIAFELTREPDPERKTCKVKVNGEHVPVTVGVGDVLAFSEKGQLSNQRTFREWRVGDEFRMQVVREKDTGKPSPMHIFDVKVKPAKGVAGPDGKPAAPTVQELLLKSHVRRSNELDPWMKTGPGIGGTEGGEDAPF